MILLSGAITLRSERRDSLSVDLEVSTGELKALVGANGSGKSTMLDTIAGAYLPMRGVHRSPGPYGYAVQDAATGLLPWLTVRQNITAPVHLRKREKGPVEEPACPDADTLLTELDIVRLSDRLPHTLSGGERQLVNIARSFHTPGRRLLLDEPFANLGIMARERVYRVLDRVRHQCAILLVTHLVEDFDLMPTGAYVIRAGSCSEVSPPTARDFVQGGQP